MDIEQDQVVWRSRFVSPLHDTRDFIPVADRRGIHAPGTQHLSQNQSICRVVIDHENSQLGNQSQLVVFATGLVRGCGSTRNLEVKRTADPENALDPNAAPHHFDEPRTDRQPQPRTAIVPGGAAICLHKGLEDLLQSIGRDTNAGVAYGQQNLSLAVMLSHIGDGDRDFAFVSELDGISP